jgi:hypothetical protein
MFAYVPKHEGLDHLHLVAAVSTCRGQVAGQRSRVSGGVSLLLVRSGIVALPTQTGLELQTRRRLLSVSVVYIGAPK